MSKKYKIGDIVTVHFISTYHNCIITSYYDESLSTYWVQAQDGTKIPAVATDGSGRWANIIEDITNN